MFIRYSRLASAMIAVIAMTLAGCALDPMEKLSEDIDNQDLTVRQAAILELTNLRDDRAIEALVDVLVNDEDLYDMAGVALVKQGRQVVTIKKPDTILTMLANAMKNVNADLGNRARAAWCLGEIGDREAIDALRVGTTVLTAGGEAATNVQDAAKLALKKLGNDSDGAAFEIPMDAFKGGNVEVLPEVKSVAPPPPADAEPVEKETNVKKPTSKSETKPAAKAATKS